VLKLAVLPAISIHMRFDDGTTLDEAVTPNANAFIRVRKPAGGARTAPPLSPDALPLVPPKGGKAGPGGKPPADGKQPTLKYENNPYEQ
jgi:hypothetical protein